MKTANQVDQAITRRSKELSTVKEKIRKLDSRKQFLPELSYLAMRHDLEMQKHSLEESIY